MFIMIQKQSTPLIVAADKGDSEVVSILLKAGADTEVMDKVS